MQHPWCLGLSYEEYKQLMLQQMLHDEEQNAISLSLGHNHETIEVKKDLFAAANRSDLFFEEDEVVEVEVDCPCISSSLASRLAQLSTAASSSSSCGAGHVKSNSLTSLSLEVTQSFSSDDSHRIPAPPPSPTLINHNSPPAPQHHPPQHQPTTLSRPSTNQQHNHHQLLSFAEQQLQRQQKEAAALDFHASAASSRCEYSTAGGMRVEVSVVTRPALANSSRNTPHTAALPSNLLATCLEHSSGIATENSQNSNVSVQRK
mmetsp:Transcript_6079/g.8493  ORF Transcript_6079/g.8493 Transcript_6079/m.8493 type:complete len:261 (-) Transcript_6079:34-816(-)